jgi:putative acetyltransferase
MSAGVFHVEIRREATTDIAGIWQVHAEAFPTPAEANLVNTLRDRGDAVFSMVAVAEGKVVGHVLFSRMQTPQRCLGLAPVAVLSSHRRLGIAERLINAGLAHAKADGWDGVFVLGDDYYKRFGFDPAVAAGFGSPYAGPHFMGLALHPQGLAAGGGPAEYPQAFSELE